MSELLRPRDPRTAPQAGDAVSLGPDKQYTVTSIDGGAVHFDLLDRGRRCKRFMPMAAWRERMKAADVVAVNGGGVALPPR